MILSPELESCISSFMLGLKFLSLSASRVPGTVKSVNKVWAEALVLLFTSYMTLGMSCSLSVSQGKSTAGMAGVLSSQWAWQEY